MGGAGYMVVVIFKAQWRETSGDLRKDISEVSTPPFNFGGPV